MYNFISGLDSDLILRVCCFFFLVELILRVLNYVGNDIFWAQYGNSKPNLKIRTVQIMYTYPIIIAMVWINGYAVAFFFYIGNID